jgi:hypothetical protein
MNNGDAVERITKFLEREEDLPKSVSNGMLLIAIREVRDQGKINKLILLGDDRNRSTGLIARVEKAERYLRWIFWILTPIAIAFLGGIGSFLVGLIINQ